jgi:hypothetical protein
MLRATPTSAVADSSRKGNTGAPSLPWVSPSSSCIGPGPRTLAPTGDGAPEPSPSALRTCSRVQCISL